jgi:hypothetical protein
MNNAPDYTGFWVKDAITTIACAVLMAITLSACNDSDNTPSAPTTEPTASSPLNNEFSLNSLLNSIQGAKTGVEQAVGPHAEAVQERTREEVEKLFRWEYRVVEFPTDIPSIELEVKLGDLGTQGWECFHFQAQGSNLTRVTCKRKPQSALSYLKLIPGL